MNGSWGWIPMVKVVGPSHLFVSMTCSLSCVQCLHTGVIFENESQTFYHIYLFTLSVYAYICGLHMEGGGQLEGFNSLLPPCGFGGLNTVLISTETPCQPYEPHGCRL